MAAEISGIAPKATVRHDTRVERIAERTSTFDISFCVTTFVVCSTAIAAVLTSRGVAAAEWFQAAGASACVCCGIYLTAALGAGDGPEERRRAAAGWRAPGLALGGILVLALMRELFASG